MLTESTGQVLRRLPPLAQMARDVHEGGSLRRSTAAVMWVAYGSHAAFVGRALGHPDGRLPVPPKLAGAGWLAAIGGGALCVAGMRRFASPGEVEGTRHDALTNEGVYQWSRNPQYLGYILGLSGAALARRSLSAAAATALIAVVYSAWIPVEEDQLKQMYGQRYRDYLGQTKRWWGASRD